MRVIEDIAELNELLIEANIKPIRVNPETEHVDEDNLWNDVQFISSLKTKLVLR